jgi:hypothetical protein
MDYDFHTNVIIIIHYIRHHLFNRNPITALRKPHQSALNWLCAAMIQKENYGGCYTVYSVAKYRVIEKSRNPFLTHVLFAKNKLHWNQRGKKQCYIKCRKCVPRSVSSLNTEGRPERFLSCTLPVSWKRFTRRDTVDLFGTGESGNVSLNSFWQLTDLREQIAIWRDLRRFLYSHSDIVCLLIQSNCIELQPSINILIWVAWLFKHPV